MNKTKFQFPSLEKQKIGKALKLINGSLSPRKKQLRFKNFNPISSNNLQQLSPKQEQSPKKSERQFRKQLLKEKGCRSKLQLKQNKNEFNLCVSKNVFVFTNKNYVKGQKNVSEQKNMSPKKLGFFQSKLPEFDKLSQRSAYNIQYKNSTQIKSSNQFQCFKLRKINSSQGYRSKSFNNTQKQINANNIKFQFQPWDNPQGWQPQPFESMFKH